MSTGTKVVPLVPTEAQWNGLARSIIMAFDMDAKTPRKLLKHLERSGVDVPQWMRDEHEMQHLDHTISKGTRATLVYRAMVEDAPPAQVGNGGIHQCRYRYPSNEGWYAWQEVSSEDIERIKASPAGGDVYEFRVLYTAPPRVEVTEGMVEAALKAHAESVDQYSENAQDNWKREYAADCMRAALSAALSSGEGE